MLKWLYIILLVIFPFLLPAQKIITLEINGSINPVTAGYVERGIKKATKENAECLLIKLNTPGGLLKSTRVIVSLILESPVPVVVYVSPGGAHAGSAGVFITMAGHVAAMAPGTNIGAAHPVSQGQQMDPVMNEKVTNDATAFIRTIAQSRNRDTVWAEKAVRYSLSITAKEALEMNVIDLLATDMQDLLEQLNGKTVNMKTGSKTLQTKTATPEAEEMSWIERLLDILADPNIAYILLMLGFYGILFEIFSPGAIFPGVIGGICIILAFYSMHTLPINYAGLALIILGIILFILELKIASSGILGIGGTIALLLGSFMLIRNESPLEVVRISKAVIIPAVLTTAALFFLMVTLGLKAQRKKNVTGMDTLVGSIAVATDNFENTGMVMLQGELWQVETAGNKIEKGQKLKITGRRKYVLLAEPVNI